MKKHLDHEKKNTNMQPNTHTDIFRHSKIKVHNYTQIYNSHNYKTRYKVIENNTKTEKKEHDTKKGTHIIIY